MSQKLQIILSHQMSLLNVNCNRVESAFNVIELLDAIILLDVTDFSLQQDI